ncbi:MAG: DNA-processing protein DprA [Ktedonobacteraceae bacterium]
MEVFDTEAPYYPSNVLSLEQLGYWIAFSRVMGIGPVRFKLLLDFFEDDVALAWHAHTAELGEAGLDKKTIESFTKQRSTIVPQQELERLQKLRIQVITWKDPTYPPLLRQIEYAPPVLYLCGRLSQNDYRYTIAIVGTRKMSNYGRQVTEHFTRELVQGKVTIVSGLALGVDTVAHTTALDAGGRTIAVLACGLDTIYPASNYNLARRIVESGQGVLLTAFPLGIRPESGNFPARNHIISGLSLGVLVAEASQKSGALITANSALLQGREVFAAPGGIFSPGGEGVNKLIREGAHPVTNVHDILDNLNIHIVPTEHETPLHALDVMQDDAEKAIFALLGYEPMHIDEIVRASGLTVAAVSATLTIMELKGIVKHISSMHYVQAMTL